MKSFVLAACAGALLATAAPVGAQTPTPTPIPPTTPAAPPPPGSVNPPSPPGGPMIPPDVRRPTDELRGPSTVPGERRRPGDTLPAQPQREVQPGPRSDSGRFVTPTRISETAPGSTGDAGSAALGYRADLAYCAGLEPSAQPLCRREAAAARAQGLYRNRAPCSPATGRSPHPASAPAYRAGAECASAPGRSPPCGAALRGSSRALFGMFVSLTCPAGTTAAAPDRSRR